MPKQDKQPTSVEPQQFMIGSVVSMGWQLAIVVLLPLIGGNFIDKQLGTLPWFTLLGLLLAMAGMIVVVKRSLADVNKYAESIKDTKDGE